MSRTGWHMTRTDAALVLSRRLPARLDVAAEAAFPPLRRGRLAHLIRQDLWRMLRDLRGFSPVVRIVRAEGGLHVTAGGAVAGAVPGDAAQRIAAMLADTGLRARWQRDARLPEAGA